MPIVNQILSRKPAVLESATKFSMAGTIYTVADPAFGPSAISLLGAANHHGGYYREGANHRPTAIVSRGFNYLTQSDDLDLGSFTVNADYSSLAPAGTLQPFQYQRFDDVFWTCSTILNGGNFPFVAALPYGGTFNNVASWTNRSAELEAIYAFSTARCMAASNTHIYVVLQEAQSTFTLRVLRCALAGAPANVFTSVSGNINIGGDFPTAYGVRPDGQTQIIGGFTVWRSVNSGASWTQLLSSPPVGATDIYYSSAYSRWFSNGGNGPRYSDSDGADGTWAASTVNGIVSTETFSVVEKIDAEGRYLLGVSGGDFFSAVLRTYISEDGGRSWFYNQSFVPPYFDTSTTITQGQPFTVKTDRQILVYMGDNASSWNHDSGVFTTAAINL